jgi:hypothetical protein
VLILCQNPGRHRASRTCSYYYTIVSSFHPLSVFIIAFFIFPVLSFFFYLFICHLLFVIRYSPSVIISDPEGQKTTQSLHRTQSSSFIFKPWFSSSRASKAQTATHPPHSPQKSDFNLSFSISKDKKCWSNLTLTLQKFKLFFIS